MKNRLEMTYNIRTNQGGIVPLLERPWGAVGRAQTTNQGEKTMEDHRSNTPYPPIIDSWSYSCGSGDHFPAYPSGKLVPGKYHGLSPRVGYYGLELIHGADGNTYGMACDHYNRPATLYLLIEGGHVEL